MKCQNCEYEFNGKFCPKCGLPVHEQEQSCPLTEQVIHSEQAQTNSPPPKKKRLKWWQILLVFLSIFLQLLVFVNIMQNAFGCDHEWKDATCTEPKTCTKCKKTTGRALKHEWIDATCTEPKICKRCDLTEGVFLGHAWKDATCDNPKTCTRCLETEGGALGHSIKNVEIIKKATCSEIGSEKGVCTVCGKTVTREITKVAHNPSEWIVIKKATASEQGERQKKCTVCGEVVQTEKIDFSSEANKSEYKAACGSYNYQQIARNPNSYKGKLAKFTGKVIQVMYDEVLGLPVYHLRVDVTKKGSYYTDTVYVSYYGAKKEDPRILEDDIITMYGKLDGEKTYKTVMGASVTIPSFDAEFIDIH